MDGRIVVNDRDLGAGFCVADRVVVTAAHVVQGYESSEIWFASDSGISHAVDSMEIRESLDLAILRIANSIPVIWPLAHGTQRAEWKVTCRPSPHDSQLSGTVTATDHQIVNANGHSSTVMQLHVNEILADYGGYSGGAVLVDGAVVGVLVEQVHERLDAGIRYPRAANVLYAIPIGVLVEHFSLGVVVQDRLVGLPPTKQFFDTAYFDLDQLKSAILNAQVTTDERLLGFGLEATDLVVVRKLCDWLPQYLGDIDCKDWLNLRAEFMSVEAAVRTVERYYAELARVGVVCPVLVDGVSAERLADFWRGVVQECGLPVRWLVFIFVGASVSDLPQGVTALPRPVFTRTEIVAWTTHLVAHRRWPTALASAWADLIVEESSDGDQLNVRYTYEILQDGLRRMSKDPDALKKSLDERRARAIAPPH